MHPYGLSIKSYFFALVLILCSCASSSEEKNTSNEHSEEIPTFLESSSIFELTEEQSESFDALNSLQISTQGHLYSTFVNSNNAFITPDSSFTLSQTEFKDALTAITKRYGNKYSKVEYEVFVEASVLADDKYNVEYFCVDPALELKGTFLKGPPINGKWIIRSILNRRDLILEW